MILSCTYFSFQCAVHCPLTTCLTLDWRYYMQQSCNAWQWNGLKVLSKIIVVGHNNLGSKAPYNCLSFIHLVQEFSRNSALYSKIKKNKRTCATRWIEEKFKDYTWPVKAYRTRGRRGNGGKVMSISFFVFQMKEWSKSRLEKGQTNEHCQIHISSKIHPNGVRHERYCTGTETSEPLWHQKEVFSSVHNWSVFVRLALL